MNLACLPSSHRHSHSVGDLVRILRAPVIDWQALLEPLLPLTPALCLSALFFSSTIYTEAITASKYPAYAAYQQRVGMFSPVETVLKGIKLTLTGKRGEVEKAIWGSVKSE